MIGKIEFNIMLENLILSKLRGITDDLEKLKTYIYDENNSELIDFNNEYLELDKVDITKALKYHDVYYDCKILAKYFLKNKNNLPIIIINTRVFKYRYNNKWIVDYGGNNIKNILTSNLRNTYMKYNILGEFENTNLFILNQEHITNLSKQRYKNKLFKEFINEVLKMEK